MQKYIILIKIKYYEDINKMIKTSYYIGTYGCMADAATEIEDIFGSDLISCEFEFLNDGTLCEVPASAIEEIRQLNEIC